MDMSWINITLLHRQKVNEILIPSPFFSLNFFHENYEISIPTKKTIVRPIKSSYFILKACRCFKVGKIYY